MDWNNKNLLGNDIKEKQNKKSKKQKTYDVNLLFAYLVFIMFKK